VQIEVFEMQRTDVYCVRCTRTYWWQMVNLIQSLHSTIASSCRRSRLLLCSLQTVG